MTVLYQRPSFLTDMRPIVHLNRAGFAGGLVL